MRFSYKRALNVLKKYAIKEGFTDINTDYNDISNLTYEFNTGEPISVYIEGKHTWEIKTYLMLHELGHHELRKNYHRFSERFPAIAKAEKMHRLGDKRLKRRTSYVVSCLEEEYAAWDAGIKLGKRFDIKINIDRWISFKSKCLKAYINYYATLKR